MRVCFSFFVFNALVFLLRDSGLVFAFYTVCALHEAGHILALTLQGGRVRTVELSGAGIRIITQKGGRIPVQGSLFVLLAGPAANIAVYIIMKLSGCCGAFCTLNLMAAVYNMLPYYSLDGGAVIKHFTSGTVYERSADTALNAVKLIITVCAAAAVYLCGICAVPALIASAALFIGDMRPNGK